MVHKVKIKNGELSEAQCMQVHKSSWIMIHVWECLVANKVNLSDVHTHQMLCCDQCLWASPKLSGRWHYTSATPWLRCSKICDAHHVWLIKEMRHKPILNSSDQHARELQTLWCVEGHQAHTPSVLNARSLCGEHVSLQDVERPRPLPWAASFPDPSWCSGTIHLRSNRQGQTGKAFFWMWI